MPGPGLSPGEWREIGGHLNIQILTDSRGLPSPTLRSLKSYLPKRNTWPQVRQVLGYNLVRNSRDKRVSQTRCRESLST